PVEVTTGEFSVGGEKLPAISASASRDAKGLLHISLVNIDSKNSQEITIDIRGSKFTSVTGRILAGEKIQDHNTFENPNKVQPGAFKDAVLSSGSVKVNLPAHSVVVLELK